MATTITPRTITAASIEETLCHLGTAEQLAQQLTSDQAFDVECALTSARQALERAQAILSNSQLGEGNK